MTRGTMTIDLDAVEAIIDEGGRIPPDRLDEAYFRATKGREAYLLLQEIKTDDQERLLALSTKLLNLIFGPKEIR